MFLTDLFDDVLLWRDGRLKESDGEDLLCVGYDGERKGWAGDGNGVSLELEIWKSMIIVKLGNLVGGRI